MRDRGLWGERLEEGGAGHLAGPGRMSDSSVFCTSDEHCPGAAAQLPGARQQWEMGPGAQRRGPATDGDLSITVSWVGALVQRDWL